jgi:hypothetical protein
VHRIKTGTVMDFISLHALPFTELGEHVEEELVQVTPVGGVRDILLGELRKIKGFLPQSSQLRGTVLCLVYLEVEEIRSTDREHIT